MRKATDGGTAFPETDYYDEKPIGSSGGMTLRDYFAGQALIMLSKDLAPMSAAVDAYDYADAMLAERNKSDKDPADEAEPA